MKRKIRMIGFDLDGTMLDSNKRLSPKNREAVRRAAEAGVVVLPATGRPQAGIPKEILSLTGVRYLLASNGTRIVDLTGDKVIHAERLSREQTRRLAEALAGVSDGMWELYADGNCYIDAASYHLPEHPDVTPQMRVYYRKTRIPVQDLLLYIEEKRIEAEKFQVFYENEDRRCRVMELLEREGNLDVSSSTPYNLEIISEKAGKGSGLLALGALLGISPEEIMAVGDSKNDWDMLKKAGMPVVMANGDAQTKALAKFLTRSNDEDGVAYAIEQLVLDEKGV